VEGRTWFGQGGRKGGGGTATVTLLNGATARCGTEWGAILVWCHTERRGAPATRGRSLDGSGPAVAGAGGWRGSAARPVQNKGGEATDAWAPATMPSFISVKPVKNWSNKFEFKFYSCSNFDQSKKDLPELRNFEIKYGFEGFKERRTFSIETSLNSE
jgi:hypothetical protein